jgi:hypothetical protein
LYLVPSDVIQPSEISAQEFTELQTQQNDDLTKCCETFFETLDGFAETKNKHRSATWPLQMMLLVSRLIFRLPNQPGSYPTSFYATFVKNYNGVECTGTFTSPKQQI